MAPTAKPPAVAQPKARPKHDEQDDADDRDGAVLPIQIGPGARLDRRRDFLHARVAGRLRQDPAHRDGAVEDGNDSGCDGQK